ncbi:MAG: hypothetical protein SVY53_01505 [Chloroflexota bacterium]|nr:hypothetical protein [Chloroflexota bacterium]
MIIPIFPKLTPELSPRVENALIKTRDKRIPESELVAFLANMTSSVYTGVVTSPRVKDDFETQLPPLVGKKLRFDVDPFAPWIIEVVPEPHVISLRMPDLKDDQSDLPGFGGTFSVMKDIIIGTIVVITVLEAVRDKKLWLINASESNPVPWIKDLFTLVGPAMDRKDLVAKSISQAMPVLDTDLRKMGC